MAGPMPPQGGPPQAGAPSSGGIDVSKIPLPTLIQGMVAGLDRLSDVIGQSKGTSQQEKQMISQIESLFGQLVQSLGQGGADQDDGPPQPGGGSQGQTVSPEAAGNPGAKPSPM